MAKAEKKQLDTSEYGIGKDMPNAGPPVQRIALTVKEFSRAVGLGRTTVNALIREGEIHSFKARGRRLIPATESVDFIQRMSKHDHNR